MLNYKNAKIFLKTMKGQTDEIVWSKVWDDTQKGIDWMKELPSVSPGRWAVGYNYIYVLTRILNDNNPHKILDLGLGISSTIISYYCSKNLNMIHDIVEEDEEWANFYKKNKILSQYTTIHILECLEKEYNGKTINYYNSFDTVVKNKKYDLISIDGPKGSDRFSRRDIVDYIPEILEEDFIILLDDTNRIGEKDTIKEIKKKLENNSIEFYEGSYESIKNCHVIASKNNRFFCSL